MKLLLSIRKKCLMHSKVQICNKKRDYFCINGKKREKKRGSKSTQEEWRGWVYQGRGLGEMVGIII